MNIEKQVNSYPTKYPQGFTSNELQEFLNKNYPQFVGDKFGKAMGINTCMIIDNELLHYHIDIITALHKLTGNPTGYWD